MPLGLPRIKRTLGSDKPGPKVKDVTAGSGEAELNSEFTTYVAKDIGPPLGDDLIIIPADDSGNSEQFHDQTPSTHASIRSDDPSVASLPDALNDGRESQTPPSLGYPSKSNGTPSQELARRLRSEATQGPLHVGHFMSDPIIHSQFAQHQNRHDSRVDSRQHLLSAPSNYSPSMHNGELVGTPKRLSQSEQLAQSLKAVEQKVHESEQKVDEQEASLSSASEVVQKEGIDLDVQFDRSSPSNDAKRERWADDVKPEHSPQIPKIAVTRLATNNGGELAALMNGSVPPSQETSGNDPSQETSVDRETSPPGVRSQSSKPPRSRTQSDKPELGTRKAARSQSPSRSAVLRRAEPEKVETSPPCTRLPPSPRATPSRGRIQRSEDQPTPHRLPPSPRATPSRGRIQKSEPANGEITTPLLTKGARSYSPSMHVAGSNAPAHVRAQSERPIRKGDRQHVGHERRLAQLVNEIDAHSQSCKEPSNTNGWLQETAQLELFIEEMKWLLSEQEKSVARQRENSNISQQDGQDESASGDDQELANANQQMKRLELEHSQLLDRLRCMSLSDADYAAEMKSVEDEIVAEQKRQRRVHDENRRRERSFTRNVVDGQEFDASAKAVKEIARLEADIGVWQVKNNSLQKLLQDSEQMLRNAEEKQGQLAQKAQHIGEVLDSSDFATRQAEQQKEQERIQNEEANLEQKLVDMQEARQQALKSHRRNKRDGTKETSQLNDERKKLEEKEKKAAAIRRVLQGQWQQRQLQDELQSAPKQPKTSAQPQPKPSAQPKLSANRRRSVGNERSPPPKANPRAPKASPPPQRKRGSESPPLPPPLSSGSPVPASGRKLSLDAMQRFAAHRRRSSAVENMPKTPRSPRETLHAGARRFSNPLYGVHQLVRVSNGGVSTAKAKKNVATLGIEIASAPFVSLL